MKKLMALCLSLLLVLSMVSFSVMAEETAVDFSAIANGQPVNFVTGNLNLNGNTITSSNEAVIATDGTVTRPIYEDATVSLTINGGEAVEVTVKAKTTDALYSTDFSTDSTPASKKFPGYDNWSFGNDVTNDTAISGGKLNADHGTSADDDAGYMYLYYRPATISGTRPVTFSFEVNDVASLSVGIDIRLTGTKYDAEGNKVGEFNNQTVLSMRSGTKFYGYGTGHDAAAKNPASIKYNPATGEFWLNETKATVSLFDKGTTTEGATVSKVVITNILFIDAASTARGLYSIDNFVQYEDVPAEEALASATPAEKLANYSTLLDKDYVANGGNLDALTTNLKFTAENLPADVELSWTSTNPAIASDGTVKRPMLEAQTATITGTLKVGEESISKSYNVTILPATIAGASEIIDFDTYGSVADFTVSSSATAEVVTEASGNKALKMTGGSFIPEAIRHDFTSMPSFANAERLVLEFKVKTANHSTAGTGNVSNFGLYVNGKSTAEFINYGGILRINNTLQNASPNDWHGSSGSWIDVNTNSDTYTNCKIVINLADDTVMQYVNGTSITTAPFATRDNDYTAVTSVGFYVQDRNSLATFYFDDIKAYTEQSADAAINALSEADKVAFFKGLIEKSNIGTASSIGAVLDLDNGYVDYAPAKYGAAVNWTSDNTAYIANDGAVAKLAPYGENVTVNMTATITAGNATDTVVIPVAIADITSIDTALHYDYDFTDYTAPDGAKYEIVTDEDASHGNVLKLDSTVGTSATIAHTAYGNGSRKDRFVIETDFKYDSSSTTGYPYFVVTTSAGAAGIRVDVNYNTGKVRLLTTKTALDGYDFKVSGSNLIDYDMPESVKAKEGEWTHLLIDYNALSETYQVSIDGIVINEIPVLNAAIVPTRTGGSVRHILYNHSGAGVLYADNLSLKDYDDDNVIEVNAALNAALTLYANEIIHPVLSNRTLWNKGIGLSWTNGTVFYTDESDLGNNPAGYKAVEDGPALTYKIGDNAVTAINVVSPTEVEITITATKNGYSESKTFTRKLAPVAIETLSLGTENCLNGVWAEGATGTEKMILAKYLDEKLVEAEVIDFTVVKDTGSRYDAATSFVKDLAGYTNPKKTAAYDQIKIFVVNADGITPIAYANASLHD